MLFNHGASSCDDRGPFGFGRNFDNIFGDDQRPTGSAYGNTFFVFGAHWMDASLEQQGCQRGYAVSIAHAKATLSMLPPADHAWIDESPSAQSNQRDVDRKALLVPGTGLEPASR
jgi:hypothetical protein